MFRYYYKRISLILFPIILTLLLISVTTPAFDDIIYRPISVENIQLHKEYPCRCAHMNRIVTFKEVNSGVEYSEKFHKSYDTPSGYNWYYDKLVNNHIYYKVTVFSVLIYILFGLLCVLSCIGTMSFVIKILCEESDIVYDRLSYNDVNNINQVNVAICAWILKFLGDNHDLIDDYAKSFLNEINVRNYKVYSFSNILYEYKLYKAKQNLYLFEESLRKLEENNKDDDNK